MLDFQPVQLSDREKLLPFYQFSHSRGCEYSFANLYIWGRQEYAIFGDCLVVFAHWGDRSIYVYPVGPGEKRPVLEALMDDAAQRGIPMRLTGMTAEMAAQLQEMFPGKFECVPTRDSFDYLYKIDRLADLKGKKLQQKRNHINRFLDRFPDWRAVPMEEGNLDDCRAMAADWYAQRIQADPHADYRLEQNALARAFDAFVPLQMEGLLLYGDERLIAFTMGNCIRPDTFDVNFEKAYADLPGAYPMINREFVRRLREKYPNLCYINREDDMGLPGLRRSKESYHPDEMVEKYMAILRRGQNA